LFATLAVVGAGKWFSLKEGVEEVEEAVEETVQPAPAPLLAAESVEAGPAAGTAAMAEGERSATASMGRVALEADVADGAAPIGYHWVSRPWHTGHDGRRDYARLHGIDSFRTLAPMSGRLRPPPRHR
jgi:hypothetical protein